MKDFARKVNMLLIAMLLLTGAAMSQDSDYCLKFYRKDILQTWGVKTNSSLCKVVKISKSPDALGLQVVGDKLYINSANENRTVDANWRTASPSIGGKFGVAVYRPDISGGMIMCFNETTNSSLVDQLKYEYEDGLGAFKKTTYFVPEGSIEIISGTYNSIINRWAIIIVILAALVYSFYAESMAPCTVTVVVLILATSVIEANLNLSSPVTFVIVLLLIIAGSIGCGVGIKFIGRGNDYIGWACYVLFMVFEILSTGLLSNIVSKIVSLLLIIISAAFAIRESGFKKSEVWLAFLSIGVFFSTAMMAIYTSFLLNLPALYMAMISGWTDYIEGENTTGIFLMVVCPLLGLVLAIPEIVLCKRIREKVDESLIFDYSIV